MLPGAFFLAGVQGAHAPRSIGRTRQHLTPAERKVGQPGFFVVFSFCADDPRFIISHKQGRPAPLGPARILLPVGMVSSAAAPQLLCACRHSALIFGRGVLSTGEGLAKQSRFVDSVSKCADCRAGSLPPPRPPPADALTARTHARTRTNHHHRSCRAYVLPPPLPPSRPPSYTLAFIDQQLTPRQLVPVEIRTPAGKVRLTCAHEHVARSVCLVRLMLCLCRTRCPVLHYRSLCSLRPRYVQRVTCVARGRARRLSLWAPRRARPRRIRLLCSPSPKVVSRLLRTSAWARQRRTVRYFPCRRSLGTAYPSPHPYRAPSVPRPVNLATLYCCRHAGGAGGATDPSRTASNPARTPPGARMRHRWGESLTTAVAARRSSPSRTPTRSCSWPRQAIPVKEVA
jgi:hypothetical protein